MNLHRAMLIKIMVVLAMLLAVIWSASSLVEARDAAAQTSVDVDSCRLMARRIEQLAQNSSMSGAASSDQSDFVHRRGQEALQQMGVPADHLMNIHQDSPQTIGQTAYKEVPTHISLRDMSLRQVVGFLLTMTGERSSLLVRSIRIHGPHEAGGDVLWSADVTLSHVIYEPPQAIKIVTAD